ncbi:MAG: hypothetical protein RBQ99_02835 [Trichlorobacter sp.]|jgi:hypothetical protein|nr:hypothetical protein [Trichlorobacter sp.]
MSNILNKLFTATIGLLFISGIAYVGYLIMQRVIYYISVYMFTF